MCGRTLHARKRGALARLNARIERMLRRLLYLHKLAGAFHSSVEGCTSPIDTGTSADYDIPAGAYGKTDEPAAAAADARPTRGPPSPG